MRIRVLRYCHATNQLHPGLQDPGRSTVEMSLEDISNHPGEENGAGDQLAVRGRYHSTNASATNGP